MSPTQCEQFERMLEEQPDGVLSAAAARHLETCGNCSALWSDLEAIRAAGAEWGSDEVEPPQYLWASLRQQLEFEGLIREKPVQASWLSGWFGAAPQWAVATASVSLLLIAAFLAGYQHAESNSARILPVQLSTSRAHPKLIAADLGKTLDGEAKRVFDSLPESNPALAISLRENLGIIDEVIADCEKSVREEPDDAMARDYLYGAYEEKAVLLATASDRSASEGQ
jgi:hypothetical protein